MRKNVAFVTFKKVENFLRDLKEPMYLRDISRKLNVDYNSLKFVADNLSNKSLLRKIKFRRLNNGSKG